MSYMNFGGDLKKKCASSEINTSITTQNCCALQSNRLEGCMVKLGHQAPPPEWNWMQYVIDEYKEATH